jgi:hypothetical protein
MHQTPRYRGVIQCGLEILLCDLEVFLSLLRPTVLFASSATAVGATSTWHTILLSASRHVFLDMLSTSLEGIEYASIHLRVPNNTVRTQMNLSVWKQSNESHRKLQRRTLGNHLGECHCLDTCTAYSSQKHLADPLLQPLQM